VPAPRCTLPCSVSLGPLFAVPPALPDHRSHLPRRAWPPVGPRVTPAEA